ncbi:hypothetical protein [Enterovirga sp. CN4-39]|uniref:hypothetical protein n=1 Tax=Enterovirga sp. CN4-39 TaxID=3400910 RepID=UPI003C020BAD
MNDHTRSARAKADAEFEKLQSQARAREKTLSERETQIQARDDNTARLKGLRLARDEADRTS